MASDLQEEFINTLTPRSDQHETSPYNIHTLINQQKGNENIQTYQIEAAT